MSDVNKNNLNNSPSLTVLTNIQTASPKSISKSLSKGIDDNDETPKPGSTIIPLTSSYDDLVEHKRTLYTCYSSRAITMYNVSSMKDHMGSTPNMLTLSKSTRNYKMSRSCSGEDKSIISNVSASSQNIATINSTSLTKIKSSFKDKIFVFKKNKPAQQWLDEFLKKNINEENGHVEGNDIIDSDTNLSTLFNLQEYNPNYNFPEIYNCMMKTGQDFKYTLGHEPFWQTQPKIFPDCDVQDLQTLSKELHIYQDDPDMSIEGIKYKVIDGKVIPYEGPLEAVLDSLIFPTSQETQFTDAFLVSYRFYITPLELLKFIISWFNVKLPPNPTKDQEFFYDENHKNIQQRSLKLLNLWIRLHWHDFSSSAVMSLLNKFMNQLADCINNTILYGEYTKLDTILRKQKLTLFTKQYTYINENPNTPSKSKFTVPNDTKKPWALVMTSQEFSSQLLLYERNLFKDIEPDYYIYLLEDTKLMDEDYGKFTLYKPIRIVLSYISWFHQLSQYTITVIAEQPNIKKKIFALRKFIKIAKACITFKNFNSAAAIFFSLKNQLFVRQHALWESLPNELIEVIEELDGIFSSSYNYHFELQQLELVPYPDDNVIPFFGEHIRQLIEQTKFEDKISFDYNIDSIDDQKTPRANTNNSTNSNNDEGLKENKINIMNWLSVHQIIMEIEKWRYSAKNQNMDTSKSNTSSIIGDQGTAEKTATHIMDYPKWDRMKIIEKTLPYNLSLKSSSNKSKRNSSYSKLSSRNSSYNDVIAPSPLFRSISELNSPIQSPLSAPPKVKQNSCDVLSPLAYTKHAQDSMNSPGPNTAI